MSKRFIIMSIMMISLFTGIGIYFYLKTQAIQEQHAILNNKSGQGVDLNAMSVIAHNFFSTLDMWEFGLLFASVVLILILQFTLKSKDNKS